jgi:translocator protein
MKINSKLIMWVVSFQLVSIAIGWLMKTPLDSWYLSLVKSPLTPPGYVFGVVWPVLYLLLAIVGWRLWQLKDNGQVKKLKKLYAVQMLINWAWTPVYFSMQMMGLALGMIAAMILLTMYLIREILHYNRAFSLLLVPYLIWISFAFYLNYFTLANN